MVLHAAHLLPAQGSIEVFVHHNTLHALAGHAFHEGVKRGQERFGGNPYLSEVRYGELLRSGRIVASDLDWVISGDVDAPPEETIAGLCSRLELRRAMLYHPVREHSEAELAWTLFETDALVRFDREVSESKRTREIGETNRWLLDASCDAETMDFASKSVGRRRGDRPGEWSDEAWERVTLALLWEACRRGVENHTTRPRPASTYRTPVEMVRVATGHDANRYVFDVLIRFCGSYLDQGYAEWSLPKREAGIYRSFLALFGSGSAFGDAWMSGLQSELRERQRSGVSAEASILRSLDELGIAEEDREEYVIRTLLSLRGWAGMVWEMENAAAWVVKPAPPGSLVGYLAVQLLLEQQAVAHIARQSFGSGGSIGELLASVRTEGHEDASRSAERHAYQIFRVGQALGWSASALSELSAEQWSALVSEVEDFDEIARRRTMHEAFERGYRVHALDAFANHARSISDSRSDERPSHPSFQIVCCIDDREESFRRHLEEIDPTCETFGAAGFFAVAIQYRGATDGFYKPLCPAVIEPDHYVEEHVGYSFEGVHRARSDLRSRLGRAQYYFHTRSRTFFGGIATGIVGSLATVPLVSRVVFPHLTARVRRRFGHLLQPPITQLHLHRHEDPPGPDGGHVGFVRDEMAEVVTRLLQDIGLTATADFSRLVIICGHGSSSLNNPHESAYCCGACAGKRGGPNARAFAEMANDFRVRVLVAERGIEIPEETVFIGAYHNTCDDSVVYFDLDRLPSSHRDAFEDTRRHVEEARRRNAHERCRRFGSAALDLDLEGALRHVEARSQDLAQARPEYNHATNALCLVGRRAWSRGLFLDRRAFLTSYDPAQDDDQSSVLLRILSAAIPVCAGISLEYYFSCVDFVTYGSGNKLPHNLISMLGVMEGASSDLRTGLYQQMVEIHEPLRLLFVIETTPDVMLSIMDRNEDIGRLCRGGWI